MTEETSYAIMMMLKKAKEKLMTAEIDYQSRRYDDSISRAYYAIFHAISRSCYLKDYIIHHMPKR